MEEAMTWMEPVLEGILEILGVKKCPHYGIGHRSIEINHKQRNIKICMALGH